KARVLQILLVGAVADERRGGGRVIHACSADAVMRAAGGRLVSVRGGRAVITDVPDAIAVPVGLIGVGPDRAVVRAVRNAVAVGVRAGFAAVGNAVGVAVRKRIAVARSAE